MNIKVITFDLDGVYFPSGKANFIKSLGGLGVSEDEAKRVFLKSDQMNQLYKNGKMTDEEFWSWAVSQWKINISWEEAIKLLIDSYDVDQEVSSIVKNLRAAGYKTAICSNNFPARITGLQSKFNFLNDFDIVVLSYEVGESKPSKKIFNELISKSDSEPESIVFADDNQINLAGANAMGITTFLYEDFKKYLDQLKSIGVNI